MKNTEIDNGGRLLPLVEDFYSIQGEGFHTGKPAYFIRLGGCDVGCRWCDAKLTWNAQRYPPIATDEIVARASSFAAQAVVVTGGEPLNYNLNYLCAQLKQKGLQTFIETSGSQRLSGDWDWICLSPKQSQAPSEDFFLYANELKIIVENKKDLEWAEHCATKVSANCLLFLQAEWSKYSSITPIIVEYAKNNPKWNISLQAHKFMNVP
ncbi:MAG: 7-carboxy-7-deazaguanine synthase QueE [Bacteroidales bacterium]